MSASPHSFWLAPSAAFHRRKPRRSLDCRRREDSAAGGMPVSACVADFDRPLGIAAVPPLPLPPARSRPPCPSPSASAPVASLPAHGATDADGEGQGGCSLLVRLKRQVEAASDAPSPLPKPLRDAASRMVVEHRELVICGLFAPSSAEDGKQSAELEGARPIAGNG